MVGEVRETREFGGAPLVGKCASKDMLLPVYLFESAVQRGSGPACSPLTGVIKSKEVFCIQIVFDLSISS